MMLDTRIGGGRAVLAFLRERYPPLYPIYLALWVIAAECMTVVLTAAPGPWRPTWDTALRVVALIVAGAFLRMVDDLKDRDYDAVHNPTRPVVQGRVTDAELHVAMALTAAVALIVAVTISWVSAVVLAAVIGYGLILWGVELRVARVRREPLLNLIMVCPAQFLVTAFILVGQPGTGAGGRLFAVPVVFTCAFLHVEFARKTSRHVGDADVHSYSQAIGITASAVITWGLGVFAVALELSLAEPWRWSGAWSAVGWLPLVAAVLPCVSAWRFLVRREDEYSSGWPTGFVVVFYLAIILQGLAQH